MNKKIILRAVSAAALLAAAGFAAQAQETDVDSDRTLDSVVTVGTALPIARLSTRPLRSMSCPLPASKRSVLAS
jgi:opacity protein-like surface antigen